MKQVKDRIFLDPERASNWSMYLMIPDDAATDRIATVLDVITLDLGRGKELDVKLCYSSPGSYIEFVLFKGTKPATVIAKSYKLLGQHRFTYSGATYCIEILEEPTIATKKGKPKHERKKSSS